MVKAVIKPVDDVEFNKINALREGNNDESDNFKIQILDEGALDKTLEGPRKIQTKRIPEDNLYGNQ